MKYIKNKIQNVKAKHLTQSFPPNGMQ